MEEIAQKSNSSAADLIVKFISLILRGFSLSSYSFYFKKDALALPFIKNFGNVGEIPSNPYFSPAPEKSAHSVFRCIQEFLLERFTSLREIAWRLKKQSVHLFLEVVRNTG